MRAEKLFDDVHPGHRIKMKDILNQKINSQCFFLFNVKHTDVQIQTNKLLIEYLN